MPYRHPGIPCIPRVFISRVTGNRKRSSTGRGHIGRCVGVTKQFRSAGNLVRKILGPSVHLLHRFDDVANKFFINLLVKIIEVVCNHV
jgi:hypothetical protein